jgi:hypothetical protein
MERSLLMLASIGWVACAAPDPAEGFINVEQFIDADGPSANARYIELANGAQNSLRVALNTLEDEDLANAIADAYDRGVDTRIVLDFDSAASAGALLLAERGIVCLGGDEALQARANGETAPCTLADDGTEYFDFANNIEVNVPSSSIHMTHHFAVADRVNLLRSNQAGDVGNGTRITLVGRGEDLGDDLSWEHQQLFGGTDASTLTAFSSMAKSITDNRWMYPTQTPVVLEMWMGPQERVIKRIIDSVYRARANVYVLTDDFVDPNLARALEQKAADGFDIRVIVGPRFGEIRPEYSRTFQEQDNIVKYRINDADIDHVPSVVLVDTTLDRAGMQQMAQGYVLTHDMVATSRYFGSGASLELLSASDQLMDGNLIAFDDFQHDAAAPSTEIGQLFDVIVAHLDLAEEF